MKRLVSTSFTYNRTDIFIGSYWGYVARGGRASPFPDNRTSVFQRRFVVAGALAGGPPDKYRNLQVGQQCQPC